jgi:two-component system sensor histidine kinase UhpB
MLMLIALFFIAVNVVVYIAVAISLKPIDEVIDALTDIEDGQLERRLPIFGLPEMASISRKFNGMAATMQSSIRSNHRLTQQIIRLQEAERKSLAHELHDEIGQHLTAIHVDASVIRGCKDLESAKSSATAIDGVVRQMMDIVRSMLHKLRPGGLDGESFVEALQDLLNHWQERHQNTELHHRFTGKFSALADDVQLTLYRVLQECLTNISRHAAASEVWVELAEDDSGIRMIVRDNGRGFEPGKKNRRFGLAGMQERVDSINGNLSISAAVNEGVEIQVQISKQGKMA